MKTLRILFISSLLASLAACQRPGLDLATLALPLPPETILQKYEHRPDFDMADFVSYRSKDKDLMWYRGESLSGTMLDDESSKNSYRAANYATFYVDKSIKKIAAYEVHTETQDKTAKLEAMLQEQLGKPDYYYRDKDFSSRVWERDQRFFFYSTNNTVVIRGEKTRTSDLMIISRSSPTLIAWFGSSAGFSYYGDYLHERGKPEHQGKPYRYADFFKQQETEAQSWGRPHSLYFDEYVQP